MSVKRGDPLKIKADDWNVLLGVADAARASQSSLRHAFAGTVSSGGVIVPVKNGTGSTVSRYHAMGISTPQWTPSDNLQAFKNFLGLDGVAMSSSVIGRFAVAQETIASGRIGACLIHGVTVSQITVGHLTHGYVDVNTSGGSQLVTGYCGAAELLACEAGTGTKWALLRVGQFVAPPLQAVAAEDITAGSHGSVTVQPSGETITAYLDWMDGAQDVSNGQELLVQFFRELNKYVIVGAECP